MEGTYGYIEQRSHKTKLESSVCVPVRPIDSLGKQFLIFRTNTALPWTFYAREHGTKYECIGNGVHCDIGGASTYASGLRVARRFNTWRLRQQFLLQYHNA